MKSLQSLLEANKLWAGRMVKEDPAFFSSLAQQQQPQYLWIGCSDSRVPANQIVGMLPGELFVHRNVANVVVHSDLNCLSVLQYAIDVLGIRHVIVCGHYGCGGVQAALNKRDIGLINNWLLHVRDVYHRHRQVVDSCDEESCAVDRLCELNVIEQVRNVARTTVVEHAWTRGAKLTIHGWIYSVRDGIIRDLAASTAGLQEVDTNFEQALERLRHK